MSKRRAEKDEATGAGPAGSPGGTSSSARHSSSTAAFQTSGEATASSLIFAAHAVNTRDAGGVAGTAAAGGGGREQEQDSDKQTKRRAHGGRRTKKKATKRNVDDGRKRGGSFSADLPNSVNGDAKDENDESTLSQSERKLHRERRRRNELHISFRKLINTLAKHHPEVSRRPATDDDVTLSASERRGAHETISERLARAVESGAGASAVLAAANLDTTKLNRVDVIECAVEALEELIAEKEKAEAMCGDMAERLAKIEQENATLEAHVQQGGSRSRYQGIDSRAALVVDAFAPGQNSASPHASLQMSVSPHASLNASVSPHVSLKASVSPHVSLKASASPHAFLQMSPQEAIAMAQQATGPLHLQGRNSTGPIASNVASGRIRAQPHHAPLQMSMQEATAMAYRALASPASNQQGVNRTGPMANTIIASGLNNVSQHASLQVNMRGGTAMAQQALNPQGQANNGMGAIADAFAPFSNQQSQHAANAALFNYSGAARPVPAQFASSLAVPLAVPAPAPLHFAAVPPVAAPLAGGSFLLNVAMPASVGTLVATNPAAAATVVRVVYPVAGPAAVGLHQAAGSSDMASKGRPAQPFM